jgi:hypothetical protein
MIFNTANPDYWIRNLTSIANMSNFTTKAIEPFTNFLGVDIFWSMVFGIMLVITLALGGRMYALGFCLIVDAIFIFVFHSGFAAFFVLITIGLFVLEWYNGPIKKRFG